MGINEYRYAYYKTFPIEVSDRGGTGVAVYLQDQTTEYWMKTKCCLS